METQPLLVVDDETLIRLDLVDVLEAGGFTVQDCADGSAALNYMDGSGHLCGLVTDINLGGKISGWEVARQGRKKFPNLAVVYITGDSASQWPFEGVPNSMVLQKPFADAQILNAVTTLMNQQSNQSSTE